MWHEHDNPDAASPPRSAVVPCWGGPADGSSYPVLGYDLTDPDGGAPEFLVYRAEFDRGRGTYITRAHVYRLEPWPVAGDPSLATPPRWRYRGII